MDSLRLCAEAGLVRLGAVALDGTKIGADARADGNKTLAQLDKVIDAMLAEADAVDAAEDAREVYDPPVPPGLADRDRRLERLRAARRVWKPTPRPERTGSRSAASRSTPPARPEAYHR